MTTWNDSPANVATLAELLGFDPIVARAWLRSEGQQYPNPTNPLNVRWYNRPAQLGKLTTTANGSFARYHDPAAGLADAVAMIRELAPSYGYGRILAEHGSGDPIAQARAIELSSWAAGHYGGTLSHDGLIRRLVRQYGGVELARAQQTLAIPAGTALFAHETDGTPVGMVDVPYSFAVVRRGPTGAYLGAVAAWVYPGGSALFAHERDTSPVGRLLVPYGRHVVRRGPVRDIVTISAWIRLPAAVPA